MEDGIEATETAQTIQRRRLGDVPFHQQAGVGQIAAQPGRQIVDDDHVVAARHQPIDQM